MNVNCYVSARGNVSILPFILGFIFFLLLFSSEYSFSDEISENTKSILFSEGVEASLKYLEEKSFLNSEEI